MPGPAKTSSGKNANLVKQGHTTDGRHGSNPSIKGPGVGKVREIAPRG